MIDTRQQITRRVKSDFLGRTGKRGRERSKKEKEREKEKESKNEGKKEKEKEKEQLKAQAGYDIVRQIQGTYLEHRGAFP